ncbi:MAG: hypothetical protein A2Y33_00580 [Spirochaetes bacterium GWF1_51_8]|nr:MAG: hypothetical protein A2Y33_00580 [Spirochaetes bacterium GWF1_51_8]
MKKAVILSIIATVFLSASAYAFKFPAMWYAKTTTWGKTDRTASGDTITVVYKSYAIYFEKIKNLVTKKVIKAADLKGVIDDTEKSSLALISIYGSEIYKKYPIYELVKGMDFTFKFPFDITDEILAREAQYEGIPEEMMGYSYGTKEEQLEKETALKAKMAGHGFLMYSKLLGDKKSEIMRDYKGMYDIYKPVLKPFIESLIVKIIDQLDNYNGGKVYIVDIIISLGEFCGLLKYKLPPETIKKNGKNILTGNLWTPYMVLLQGAGDCDSKNLLFTVMLGLLRDTLIEVDTAKYPKLAGLKKEMANVDFRLLMFPPKPGSSAGHLFAAVRLPYEQVAPTVQIDGKTFSLMDVTGEYIPGYASDWEKYMDKATILSLID